MTSKATAITVEATTAEATTTTAAATAPTNSSISSSSSNRYATWLDQRTTEHQQSLQSNDHQPPAHRIPNDHHHRNCNNNNLNTDHHSNINTNSGYIFLPFSLSWRNKNRNHNVGDEVDPIRGGVRGCGCSGGNSNDGAYEPLPMMLHTTTSTTAHVNGEEVEIGIWNSIELNRRQRRMEYYYQKMERFYNYDGYHPYRRFFIVCFIYWYTYILDLLTTLLLGCYTILLWYHEIYDLTSSSSSTSNNTPFNDTTNEDNSDMESAPRLYDIIFSILFALWSIRTLTAIIGLKKLNDSQVQDASYDQLPHVSRINLRRNRSSCCRRRCGLYVTSNIISPITILLYIIFFFIITWIRWIDNSELSPDLLSSKYLIPAFISEFICHILEPYYSPPQISTIYHYYEYIWFIIIMIIMILFEYIRWKVIASYRIYLIYCDQYYNSCHNNNNDNNDNNDEYDNYVDENYNTVDQRLLMEPLIIQQQVPCDRNSRSDEIRFGIPAWVIEPTPSPNSPNHHHHRHHDCAFDDDITCLSNTIMTDRL